MTGSTTAHRGPALRGAGARPRRAWLVLVLLVGLLGMHGLASNHVGMTLAAPSQAASPAASLDPGTASMPMAAPVNSGHVSGARLDAFPGGMGMTMAGLCLAVLLGAVYVAAARRLLPARARPADRRSPALLARVRALPPPQPPDLVAGLCVSRT